MHSRWVVPVLVLVAAGSWWGIVGLTGHLDPYDSRSLSIFYTCLFIAYTATLSLSAIYLHRRFAPEQGKSRPWRFVRHGFLAALCLLTLTWMQMQQALNLAFALGIIVIFGAIELLLGRLMGERD